MEKRTLNIGFDWDETVSADVTLFTSFMRMCLEAGHNVYVITAREEYDLNDIFEVLYDHNLETQIEVVASSTHTKQDYMIDRGVFIHIWIDDYPLGIVGA